MNKDLLTLPRKETCSLSGGGEDHEPPIGTGGSSFFFNLPDEISLENPTNSGGYFNYAIKKEKNLLRTYTAIFSVHVLTEEKGSKGRIIFDVYKMDENQNAKLRLWLADEFTATPLAQPNVIVDGNSGGVIRSDIRFMFKTLKKMRRKSRATHSNNDLRVIKWDLVDKDGNLISDGTNNFTAEGDDSYNFYIGFHHS